MIFGLSISANPSQETAAAARSPSAEAGHPNTALKSGSMTTWPPGAPSQIWYTLGEQISRADLASAAGQLRTVLASVSADLDHAAYLRGATDTLAMLGAFADGSGECPETKVVGLTASQKLGGSFPQHR
jgi:hypothetical protein